MASEHALICAHQELIELAEQSASDWRYWQIGCPTCHTRARIPKTLMRNEDRAFGYATLCVGLTFGDFWKHHLRDIGRGREKNDGK